MRYSPLVERYLITHRYETINNVREWNMLLTQRSEVQKDVDKKFKKFKQIAANAKATKDRLELEYTQYCEQLMQDLAESKAQAAIHNDLMKETNRQNKENGGFNQNSNMHASIHNAQHKALEDDKD